MTGRNGPRPKVEFPRPEDDRPRLARVGIIAGVGFVIGIAWPWLAGVRLVPSAPVEQGESNEGVSAAASASAAAVPASVGSTAPPKEPARAREQQVKVGEALVESCRDAKGSKVEKCDPIAFDALARPRLLALAGCGAGKGASKLLSIGFELDFDKKEVAEIVAGKSTTFPRDKALELIACAEKEFQSVKLDDLEHQYTHYSVYYFIEFVPPGAAAAEGKPPDEAQQEASGMATIGWDVALVRETPEDGAVEARLRYGTRVIVSAKQGKWYLIKYDTKGNEGWVHKNALGL